PLYLTFSSSHTHRHPRTLHSFPTRRSSDLTQAELDAYKLLGGVPSDIGIGDARFKDLNGDGKISIYGDTPGDDGDVVNLGNTAPRYTYGMNLDLKWNRFDLGVFMQGVGKRTLFRDGDYRMPWSDWWRQP